MYKLPQQAFSPHISRGYTAQQNSQPVNNEAPPATAVTLEERGGSKFMGNFSIELRRDREMKQYIIGNVVLSLHGLEAFTQPGIVLYRWRIEIPAHKREALGKLPPCLIAKAFFLLGIGPDCIAKGVIAPRSAGYPKQGKRLRQQPLTSQGVERRNESRTGQITCHTQNHHHTRLWRYPMYQTRGTRLEALLVHRRLPCYLHHQLLVIHAHLRWLSRPTGLYRNRSSLLPA